MTAKYMTTRFKRWHLSWLMEHSAAAGGMGPWLSPAERMALEQLDSVTVTYNGDVIACGGVVPQWAGRSIGWAYLNDLSPRHMVAITRAAQELVARTPGRIELTVRADFPPGQRWARMLGFEVETPLLRRYGPEGEDHIGYVRYN